MPSPSCTSSSRLAAGMFLRCGFLWTAVAFVAIECALEGRLSHRFFSHEVDRLVFDVEHGSFSPRVLVAGDSVGRQIAGAAARMDTNVVCMASNGGVHMAAHYFLLRRFAARYGPPPFVVFLMRDPTAGDLRSILTENYVQRCFGRADEIASMAAPLGSVRRHVPGLPLAYVPLPPAYPDRPLAGAGRDIFLRHARRKGR